ncbi:hypothetical protein [Umezawaea sp. Da 62-37]|uniref:hypothetical protein n=1 Tax=Umezawaea sp. Da 62-37 TaxID=3075927 RepID=UPI0028F70B92|nr:hypothetical protein [Umezawaea sp. Da 62-37]WNV91744.1 hypothetical protein RM788_26890 [Umezawaea sp. Da 62-37]
MQWDQWVVSVTSGVSVASILAAARATWVRRQVPKALSRSVGRRNYVAEVLQISRQSGVEKLEAFVPNLEPANGKHALEEVQVAWEEINGRRGALIITRDSDDCIKGGVELLGKGIETRIIRSHNADDLSYHVFSGKTHHTVLNHKSDGRDHPNIMTGISPAKVFQAHFQDAWAVSSPIESVLAEQILGELRTNGRGEIVDHFRDLSARYSLGPVAEQAVLRHVAFRHSVPVVFVTGLPGAGKSLVRRRLAAKLGSLRFQVEQLSDYVYAFHDFVHAVMMLDEQRGQGFSAELGGAFKVDHEENLHPALHALAHQVSKNRGEASITLVEFARTDVVSALKVFDAELLSNAHLIYVRASATTRSGRLDSRAQPPRIRIAPSGLSIVVPDDHRLPSSAKSMYLTDDFDQVRVHEGIADRVHIIDNEIHDPTFARLDEKLDRFVEDVVRPYQSLGVAV